MKQNPYLLPEIPVFPSAIIHGPLNQNKKGEKKKTTSLKSEEEKKNNNKQTRE